MNYISQSKAVDEVLLKMMNADIQIMVGYIEDTLMPSVEILKIKTGLMGLLKDVLEFEKKTGETEKSKERKNVLQCIINSCSKIDCIATQNNSFQLMVKFTIEENKSLRNEINALKKQIENFNKEL